MVKVTVGEQKPQSEKPFPKLMITDSGNRIGYFLGSGRGLWLTGPYSGDYVEEIHMDEMQDCNEPITIQNV